MLKSSLNLIESIFTHLTDPFVPFENLMCAFLFGGIWDSLAKLFGKGQVKEEASKDAKKAN